MPRGGLGGPEVCLTALSGRTCVSAHGFVIYLGKGAHTGAPLQSLADSPIRTIRNTSPYTCHGALSGNNSEPPTRGAQRS